jgi:hypothetical protein
VHSTPRTALASLLVSVLAGALLPNAAAAHPSDLGTLTLDLLLDRGGLVLVDGAANRASYEDRPSPGERRAIAREMLGALGVRRGTYEVEPADSLLYHEVGFTAWLHRPLANTGQPGQVRVDTRRLQELAGRTVGALRLDVCRVAFPDQSLVVDTPVPPSATDSAAATTSEWDRRDCVSWRLQPGEPSFELTAHVEPGAASLAPRALELPCGPPVDLGSRSTPVLASFALIDGEPLHVRATGVDEPASQLVAEGFTLFRESTRITLSVPRAWHGKLRLGTREQRATRSVTARCRDLPDAHAWRVIPMTFGVDEPACVPIVVTLGEHARRLRVGIGTRCPTASARSGARSR